MNGSHANAQHSPSQHQPQPQPRSRRRPRHPRSTGQLNMTSMIDVVFLLLVFFLLTANFVEGEGVITASFEGEGPKPWNEPPPPTNPIKIRISSVGTSGCLLDIENHPVAPRTFSQLSKMLSDMQYNSKLGRSGPFSEDTPVIIASERTVRWQHVVNAFNAAVGAGYKRVSFSDASSE